MFLRMAILLVWSMGYTHLIFESDCRLLIYNLNGTTRNYSMDDNVFMIFLFGKINYYDVHWSHPQETDYNVAHLLAKLHFNKLNFVSSRLYPFRWIPRCIALKSCIIIFEKHI